MLDLKCQTISQIKDWVDKQPDLTEETLSELLQDSRTGVRGIAETYKKKMARIQLEKDRMAKLWDYEKVLWTKGFQLVAGVDEAGRGPLAGPVVAGACILPRGIEIPGINDSKQLSEEQRETLFPVIREQAIAWGVGIVDVEYIDTYNILQATYEAMRRAIQSLKTRPDHLLNDAVTIPDVSIPQLSIVKGDAKSHSIAAASILAKVTRDKLMKEYGQRYPQYGFENHMGYGTPEHLDSLKKYGACPIHRRSFAPVAEVLK